MSFPEDLPQNARFWPKHRIDDLRAMASKDVPTDPAERERQYQWFREFARDAPAWMDVDAQQTELATQLVELRTYAQGLVAHINRLLTALQDQPAYRVREVETAEYNELIDGVSQEGGDGQVKWNWLTDLPGPKSATVDSNQKMQAGLAKIRRREEEAKRPAPEVQAEKAPEPGGMHNTRKMDATIAQVARDHGMDVATYLRASFGTRRIKARDLHLKMHRFVGVFRSPQGAAAALAARLKVTPPDSNLVSWMKARAEVFNRDRPNHYAVWLAPNGRKNPRKAAS